MKKTLFFTITFFYFFSLLYSCVLNEESEFIERPLLIIERTESGFMYTRSHSSPRAESYNIYWIADDKSINDIVDEGNVIIDAPPIGVITIDLAESDTVSAIAAANLSGYKTVFSDVARILPVGTPPTEFITVPVLTVTSGSSSLTCSWTAANPAADKYIFYWVPGNTDDPSVIKSGSMIDKGSVRNHTISELTNGVTYSVIVTAVKTDFESRDSQPVTGIPSISAFTRVPGLSLIPGNQSIYCLWPPTDPWSSSYDIYYREGTFTDPVDVKAGIKITGANDIYGERIAGLNNNSVYSVIVSANRSGYISVDSPVRTAKPAGNLANSKRGVSYGFGTGQGGNAGQDMALLVPGLSWFYNWGNSTSSELENLCIQNEVVFIPMAWNALSSSGVNTIKNYLSRHPEIEYIMTYNEPMFTDQANMTPAQAAANWPTIKQLAADCNLKIVGPALNYGQMMGPKEWFQAFIEQPNVSLNDMHAIALHCYMNYPSANKWFTAEEFTEYGLPVWMTEFCAWNSPSNIPDALWQEKFMSEICIYYEQDPRIEKYAWFIPRSSWAGTNNTGLPYHALFAGSSLSRLGQIFVNMSFCDKSVWVPAGEIIKAAQFTANHLSEWITQTGWPGNAYGNFPDTGSSVHFRPTTDPGGQILDIYNFTNNNWVEYQVDLSSSKAYTLSMRFETTALTNMDIFIDNMTVRAADTVLNSGNWTATSVGLGNLSAGRHTIRLKVTNSGGNCALNWIKVE